ncbi:hypothetical protein BH24ACT6_BH24ACT6_01250 [soil metagenome]
MTAAEEAEAIERLAEVFVPLGARQGCGYVADSGAVRAACRRLTARRPGNADPGTAAWRSSARPHRHSPRLNFD